jgi:hypothetical protein
VTTSSDDAPPAPGPYLQTVSGRRVNPFDPDPAQLDAGEAYLGDMPHPIKHRSALGAWHWPELEGVEPLDLELTAWSPDQAADEFAKRYAELEARRRAGMRLSQNITSTRG